MLEVEENPKVPDSLDWETVMLCSQHCGVCVCVCVFVCVSVCTYSGGKGVRSGCVCGVFKHWHSVLLSSLSSELRENTAPHHEADWSAGTAGSRLIGGGG